MREAASGPERASLPGETTLAARAYGRGGRLAAGTLIAIAGASLPVLLAALFLAHDPPITPPILLALVVV